MPELKIVEVWYKAQPRLTRWSLTLSVGASVLLLIAWGKQLLLTMRARSLALQKVVYAPCVNPRIGRRCAPANSIRCRTTRFHATAKRRNLLNRLGTVAALGLWSDDVVVAAQRYRFRLDVKNSTTYRNTLSVHKQFHCL